MPCIQCRVLSVYFRVMRHTRLIMGMPVTVEVAGPSKHEDLEEVFAYFASVDERFSTYKKDSEIMRINRGELAERDYSAPMREVLALAEQTKKETNGYFDIRQPRRLPADRQGSLDPSGIVKGWAIRNAAQMLLSKGYRDFYVDAGGDIESHGANAAGAPWSVGIRNPFNRGEVVKTVYPRGAGVATSGTYIRGQHIYNPHQPGARIDDIVSLTVIAPNVLEADRLATAAFAMGARGIGFIASLPHCEGYQIDAAGTATMTPGLGRYTTI